MIELLKLRRNPMPAQKAIVAQVNIGKSIQIEGLQLPDGSYAIGVSQIASLFSVTQNNATRDVKALLGDGFAFTQVASTLSPKKLNILTLEQFETVMLKLAFSGDQAAKDLTLALAGTALNELFCDAFGVVSDASTRQAQIEARLSGIAARRSLTDSIKDQYLATHEGCDSAPFYAFSNPSDELNRLLTGHSAKYWKEKFGLTDNAALRDRWGRKQLRRIEMAEELAQAQMDRKGLDSLEAIRFAVEALGYDAWDEEALLGDGTDRQKHYMRAYRSTAKPIARRPD
jgi:hypothetical protein